MSKPKTRLCTICSNMKPVTVFKSKRVCNPCYRHWRKRQKAWLKRKREAKKLEGR